ncbi:MAG: hypothetical protein QF824_03230 [Candidatus Woesearchaeota archaeon]|jgi:hypothetical protein|nr:hypothetical protein [Candidatus Woesearchaeota archaeon]
MAKKVKQKKSKKYVRVCPKCKSGSVRMDKSTLQQTGALPTMYICGRCGHSGNSFPEVEISKLKGFEKEVDKKHLRFTKKDKTELIDTSYGEFEVKIIWKVLSIVFFLAGIFYLTVESVSGAILLLIGIFMFYITYFEKRKLKRTN